LAGTSFGRYVLLDRIAVGGMAEIFRAQTEGLGGFKKTIAIKRLHPQYSKDKQFVDMLIDEAKIAVRLKHPNIVDVLDLGQVGAHFYIAMEFVEGRDLFHVLKKLHDEDLQMPLETAVYLTQEILAGLHHAHFRRDSQGEPLNIIHRDVSPQNILLSMLGEVKVSDFGIAKAEKRLTETASGIIKGKFYYMSPEQANGLDLDHRSDLFSVGIVLYECLTASPLYDDDEEAGTLLTRVQKADIPSVISARRDIPSMLNDIVMRALNPNREKRYQTALEFHRALSEFLVMERSYYNRVDLAMFVRQLESSSFAPPPPVPSSTGTPVAQPDTGSRPLDRSISVNPKTGLRRKEASEFRDAPTELGEPWARPASRPIPRPRPNSTALLDARERRLRLALTGVLIAIVLVCMAIVYVITDSPPRPAPESGSLPQDTQWAHWDQDDIVEINESLPGQRKTE